MKRTTAQLALAIVFLLQSAFLAAIIFEKTNVPLVLSLLVVISVLTVVAWRKIPHHSHDHLWEDSWLIAFVAIGAVFTFFLSSGLHISSVTSVGITGVAASFIPKFTKDNHLTQQIPAAIYCGAFVGMTSPGIAHGYKFILLAAVTAGILLILSKNVFHGYGGKLGTVAFGGVVLVAMLIEYFLK
ncbi:hypothetical protein LVD15_17350 [Fulvivirga maritima]|uniref:hypothetical protein n=1 Tax=Fulvivirga maritima TaxID=2904247 RepID=UPI001F2050E8|nr:hypothetical protein [Fulvivirga maritima]UII25067.1 hypothetical protein LVD15_17350 [Fulvivirga maritima]